MMMETLKIWSTWDWEHWRNGMLINKWRDGNVVTKEGRDQLLNSHFRENEGNVGDPISQWHIAVFEDDYTPLETDTYASPGYTECYTIYEATRPVCQFSAASGQAISNVANQASFTFSLDKDIYGSALVGGTYAEVIGDKLYGESGVGTYLFSASKFSSGPETFFANDVGKVAVTLALASG